MTVSLFQSDLSLVNQPLKPLKNGGNGRTDKWDPKPFEEEPSQQNALNSISIRDPVLCRLLKEKKLKWNSRTVFKVSTRVGDILENPVKLAESYSDLICHHVAMRVALFFQQAIICYKTPFQFEIADTEGQIFGSKTIKFIGKSGNVLEVKYQAAHSSTIPSLKACLKKDYDEAIANGKQPTFFSFLGGSYLETLDNSTVGLPIFVNQMDTLIDGKSQQANGLRGDAIALINKVALAKLHPCDATKQFLEDFLRQLGERSQKSARLTEEKKKVISIYSEQVKEMIVFSKNDLFFDGLISANFYREKNTNIPVLRKIVYERKFEIIREAQLTESKIQETIDQYFKEAIKPAQKHSVRRCLTYSVQYDPIMRAAFQKLFAISIEAMQKDRVLCQKLKDQYTAKKKKYDDALRSIRVIVKNFQTMEQGFQALLLSDFRLKLCKKTQKELSASIQQVVKREITKEEGKEEPDEKVIAELKATPTSPSTISRLENSRIHIIKDYKSPEKQRRKVLTINQAQVVSKALDVEPGYFFSSFFCST